MREKEFLPLVSERLGIAQLNDMQRKMMEVCNTSSDIILLSPTGSGKTLAFILPVLKLLKAPTGRVQAVVIAPGRELVLQIASIFREIAAGFKVTALYGGHKVEEEVNSLSVTPDIVVGTPGRLLDHARRDNIDLTPVRILVLDEFDKSLELGFEDEMRRIIKRLKNVSHTFLTSATDIADLPDFINLKNPLRLDFTGNTKARPRLRYHRVDSDDVDKLVTLRELLCTLTDGDGRIGRTIVFVNHRESAERVCKWLRKSDVAAGIYHGALDQIDREKAVEMFNNGTTPVLVATDLAARGLDIALVESIIHYHLPDKEETFIHRNGRTARANASGDVYVIVSPREDIPEYIDFDVTEHVAGAECPAIKPSAATLFISAGKKDKISRGDILGFLVKECGLEPSEVGKISVADRYALAAIPARAVKDVLEASATAKLKGKKIRIMEARVVTEPTPRRRDDKPERRRK